MTCIVKKFRAVLKRPHGEDMNVVGHRPSILITDDDRGFRETVQGTLEPQGFRTLLAADGREAVQMVEGEVVHLVLLDMHMPRLNGLDTLRQVRRIRALLPCVLLSANLDESIVRAALSERVFSVLSKPVSRQKITLTVRSALERSYNWRGPDHDRLSSLCPTQEKDDPRQS